MDQRSVHWALGNVGVAVFFSISGFLAYCVLWRDERRLGRLDYSYFLLRRILRIWPAYLAIIAAAWLWAWYRGVLPPQTGLGQLLTFTINLDMGSWRVWPIPELAPLWSIAVEEQFYLVAPLMYIALRSRYALVFCVGVILCSNAIRQIYIATDTHGPGNGGIYYMTYSYADTFLAGALVAHWYLARWRPSAITQWASLLIAIPLLIVVAKMWGLSLFPPYAAFAAMPYALLPVAGALIMVAVLPCNRTAVTNVLGNSVFSLVGKLSYSIYLVHVIAITMALRVVDHTPTLLYNAVAILLTLVLAAILYVVVERPFMGIKNRISPRRLAPWPAVCSIALVSIGLLRYALGFT